MEQIAVSPEQAAKLAGIGTTALYKALGSSLPSCKVGTRRLVLLEDLRTWLRAHRTDPRPVVAWQVRQTNAGPEWYDTDAEHAALLLREGNPLFAVRPLYAL